MKQVIYKTKAECVAAIKTLEAIGVDIPVWMEKQYKDFVAAEDVKAVVANSDTPIYDTLVAL